VHLPSLPLLLQQSGWGALGIRAGLVGEPLLLGSRCGGVAASGGRQVSRLIGEEPLLAVRSATAPQMVATMYRLPSTSDGSLDGGPDTAGMPLETLRATKTV
jgi:hypothetical protein